MERKWRSLGWPLSILASVAVTWLATVSAMDASSPGDEVHKATLHSRLLKENRDYFVHLPDEYEGHPLKRYPVIYVLDGYSQSLHTAATAAVLSRAGVFAETIVVGIPNQGNEGRQRDYTPPGMLQDAEAPDSPQGAADAFLGFLRQELIPAIEGKFRASGVRILAGNSRGGLFVVYALMVDAKLFSAYHAHSPALWRDEGAMLGRLDGFLRANPTLQGRLFLSLGGRENPKMTRAFNDAVAILKVHAPPGLHWRTVITEGATHDDNAERATPVALHWTAEGLRLDVVGFGFQVLASDAIPAGVLRAIQGAVCGIHPFAQAQCAVVRRWRQADAHRTAQAGHVVELEGLDRSA
jgi:predicted alpha/beta superfamily hydrolase